MLKNLLMGKFLDGKKVLQKTAEEIGKLKEALLDENIEKITPKLAQERFWGMYSENQKVLPAGEPWAERFENLFIDLFKYIKEIRPDIFEEKGNIVWEAFKQSV